jgi:predicted lipoprotein with Yx(FWY)xxD motif
VSSSGRTLYTFMPDKHAKVTCTGTCAELWPPAKLSGSGKPTASGQVNPALLGSDPDPEGGRVITYAGWPLYTYVSDSAPGLDTGQGLESSGGLWYVIAPSGKPIVSH